jgi:hypothetical protein
MSAQEIERLARLSRLLDSKFRIPGTSIRFGWDQLLGIVPGVGDLAAVAPASYLIYRAHRLGARKRTIGRMVANTGVDFAIGSIPLLGDVFDIYFKSNKRNIALLQRELARRTPVYGGPSLGKAIRRAGFPCWKRTWPD